MTEYATLADVRAIEDEMPWPARKVAGTVHEALARTGDAFGARPAISFQLLSSSDARRVTLSWADVLHQTTRAANLFRRLGVGESDGIAYVLPTIPEAAIALLAGMTAGIVTPINPLLEPRQIAAILRRVNARVVVTLRAFPQTDIAAKVARAVADCPEITTVLEVDLGRYLHGMRRLALPFVRPRQEVTHKAEVRDFHAAIAGESDALSFTPTPGDRVAARFHTGGTTGMPKVTQHRMSGMLYNGWLGSALLFTPDDVVMCPLPFFHVFATYPIFMSMLLSGGHIVMPTPAGYRGKGVFDNFWKLIARYRCTYLITVPTAIAVLMQHEVDADISSLRAGFSGSAPMPVELYNRFRRVTGVEILEGYGLTECTCLVAVNPPAGEKKIGSVGLPMPYTRIRIMRPAPEGPVDAPDGEIGEICVASPGVFAGGTYADPALNRGLVVDGRFLRTGDLGRVDGDGYLWITGRAKDLIIRGGHNIDPEVIEDALNAHPAVAVAGAVGEPDAHSGELPAVYVELVRGARATPDELLAFCHEHMSERAAVPKFIGIVDELPKTAVGKVFKPALRKWAITRVYDRALRDAGLDCAVADVADDARRGLVVRISGRGRVGDERVGAVLGQFIYPWEWADD